MKNTTPILALAFLCLAITSFSQPEVLWQFVLNGTGNNVDLAKYVLPTSDGNCAVLGTGYNTFHRDMIAAKMSITDGSLLAQAQAYDTGNNAQENCFSSMIALEHGNGYIFAGDLELGVTDNVVFMVDKTNLLVQPAFTHTLSGTGVSCIENTGSPNIILVGSPYASTGSQNARVQRVDIVDGILNTYENLHPNWGETLKLIKQTSDGGVSAIWRRRRPYLRLIRQECLGL